MLTTVKDPLAMLCAGPSCINRDHNALRAEAFSQHRQKFRLFHRRRVEGDLDAPAAHIKARDDAPHQHVGTSARLSHRRSSASPHAPESSG
jgi:hypothetical protein